MDVKLLSCLFLKLAEEKTFEEEEAERHFKAREYAEKEHAELDKAIPFNFPSHIMCPELLEATWHVSHYSSNLDSLKDGFKQRRQTISFARQPAERMSVPTHRDIGGTAGVVFAIVSGKGLDYRRKEHQEFIRSLLEYADENNLFPQQFAVFDMLRDIGVDWVNQWNGIGSDEELHVLNASSIHITRMLPISDREKLRILPRPRWF